MNRRDLRILGRLIVEDMAQRSLLLEACSARK